ncbi:MAG TPA: histidine kinase [Ginsengibacter sp.]|nr:histidine kinase [Ginsengibacter sp.]HRP16725.1 histidine kinase [Ginsengibacter sp.]HRP43184.1 histidine kinase [Ginsengibacter sp.]
MNKLLSSVNTFLYNDFIFSSKHRILRHALYWVFHTLIWAFFWQLLGSSGSYGREVINMTMWLPIFILYGYPMAYWAVPQLLMKEKLVQFLLLILAWGFVGLYIDQWFRAFIYIPLQEAMGFKDVLPAGPLAFCYLCLTTSAAIPMVIKFFKFWNKKQQDLLNVQQEKMVAELQLLKAQVHPHFLFNTLNNIYSFSLEHSPKTPELVLKLSNLLSYMLYDCKAPEVRLEKELEIMKNYIELERERYGNKIDISWNINGNVGAHYIAPLMLLPFIENAFKHGTSEQIEKPWLSVDLSVKGNSMKVKISNSKNEGITSGSNGIGIVNVRKRLQLIYPDSHTLKLSDESDFFVVSLNIDFTEEIKLSDKLSSIIAQPDNYETAVPAY